MRRSRARLRGVSATLLAAGLSACAAATTSYRDPRIFEPTHAEDVQVLAARPERTHLVIATLCVEGETRTTTRDELLARLRREAAQLGGDAVVIFSEENVGEIVAPIVLGAVSSVRVRRVAADVLVFADANRPWSVALN